MQYNNILFSNTAATKNSLCKLTTNVEWLKHTPCTMNRVLSDIYMNCFFVY